MRFRNFCARCLGKKAGRKTIEMFCNQKWVKIMKMADLKNKEFCFWLVPSSDGRVRKFRIGAVSLGAVAIVSVVVALAFLFVASDYARVQMIRAQNFFNLKLVSAERDKLMGHNNSLESEVVRLKSENERVLAYEKQVKQRMDELVSVLKSAQSLGLPVKQDTIEKADEKGGVGGAEVACLGKGGKKCKGIAALLKNSVANNEIKARLNPSAFLLSDKDEDADDEALPANLVEEMDHYISAIKVIPVGPPAIGYTSSGYGYRLSPFGEGITLHEGVDYNLPEGSVVSSTADGVVKEVRKCPTYGLVVDVIHSNNVVTRYAHLSKAFVSAGEKICKDEIIGLVGSTGRSTGPHLHYEVIIDGTAKNPQPFIELASRLEDSVHS